jgi:hypothetical protein
LIVKASRQSEAAVSQPLGRLTFWLLGGVLLLPAQAMADEIPFFGTNEYVNFADGTCILCVGPWFRKSASCGNPLPIGTLHENFYSAELNIFSPLGLWSCELRSCAECSPLVEGVSFCLDVQPNRIGPVELTANRDGSLGVKDFGPPPCSSVAAAGFLGDASSSGRDNDVFRFDGEANETVTVTLEPHGASGGAGEIARLILREEGGRRLDAETGALPLELTATLPAAGSYAVEALEVGESGAGSGASFRGHFLLTVRSDAEESRGESLLLEPAESTEQP